MECTNETRFYGSDIKRVKIVKEHNPHCTEIECEKIQIGSFKFTPTQKVIVSTKGISIAIPPCQYNSQTIFLNIQIVEVVKVLAHFGEGQPVIFLYLLPSCCDYIMSELCVLKKKDIIFNSLSPYESCKRIILFSNNLSRPDVAAIIKLIYYRRIDILTEEEALKILAKVEQCGVPLKFKKKKKEEKDQALQKQITCTDPILQYPVDQKKNQLKITLQDYATLAKYEFLNDVIIEFYLKYLSHEVLTEEQKQKTFMFSSFFYSSLTCSKPKTAMDQNLSPAEIRHKRVQGWTKNIDLFEKDFIIVPINENQHWFLAVICYPGLTEAVTFDNKKYDSSRIMKSKENIRTPYSARISKSKPKVLRLRDDTDDVIDEAVGDAHELENYTDSETEETEREPIKQPCILIFDSLPEESRINHIVTLREYLTCEIKHKLNKDYEFNSNNMRGCRPVVPMQNNYTDCGIYLIHYVEMFFKDPIKDFRLPINLENWFDEMSITRKREEVAALLKSLVKVHNNEYLEHIPDLDFPTLNGELIKRKLRSPPVPQDDEEEDDGEINEKTMAELVEEKSKRMFDEITGPLQGVKKTKI